MVASDPESNGKKETEIIDIMEKFGRYQKIQYLYACVPAVFMTMLHINYVFVAGDLNYRCRIPECDEQFPVYSTSWWPNATIDRCMRPRVKQLNGSMCTEDSFDLDSYEVCTEWIYETNNSAIAELNLACQPWKSNLIGTLHNVGMLISMAGSGWMSDRFGRKPTLIISAVGSCIGHLKTFTSTYYIYVLIEILEASIAGGTYTAAMVLMIEIGGKKSRILSGVLFAYAVYLGESLFAGIAMFVPYWKNLIRIINSPAILCVSLIFLLRESPRWQILNGKIAGAKNTLLYVSELNNININKVNLMNMNEEDLKKEFKMENYEHKESYKDIFKSKEIMKRVLVGAFCRFTASFVYYGLMVNSVYLPGNKYTNFMLATVMSYPGELVAMYLMNKVGRKNPLIYGYIFSGLLCAGSGWVPEEYTWLKIALFLFGKLVVSVCYTGVITYTMELFPTSVRGTLLGACSFASSVGSMLAPLTPILNTVSVILPSMFFGSTAIISGLLLTLTPETKDLPLMDTIDQVHRARTEMSSREKGKDNYGYN
ncbi:organic cation transporter protein-like [Battus philenor]|uniref:organic cation transporter protein-like n=1 Tax=Battus philenor TaxID=42288 RepID=UPI0035D05074